MEDYRAQADFDMAVLTLGRIHTSLFNCDNFARSMDYFSWFKELFVLYREVSTEMKGDVSNILKNPVELEVNPKKKDEFVVIHKMFSEIEPLINRKNGVSHRDLFLKLHVLEIYLRRVLKDSGMYMKMKDDARFAL